MNIIERLFNKKKNEQVKGLIQPPKFDVPEVIKESAIKPTKCAGCYSVYQAKYKHLCRERDIAYLDGRCIVYTICPVCSCHNKVEFEDDTEINGL